MGIFYELLADCRGPLFERARGQIFQGRFCDARIVQAVMFIKALVLRRDEGVFYVIGQAGKFYFLVRVFRGNVRDLFVRCVVNGGVTFGKI